VVARRALVDKPSLKRAYKQAKKPMGVYGIRSSLDATIYVGSAIDLPARFNRHRSELRFGSHRNRELQKAWTSAGESAFEFVTLDVLEPADDSRQDVAEELQVLVDMWIQKLTREGLRVVPL
jgi:predicted GIY-YIG superfamily endonuclease